MFRKSRETRRSAGFLFPDRPAQPGWEHAWGIHRHSFVGVPRRGGTGFRPFPEGLLEARREAPLEKIAAVRIAAQEFRVLPLL